jgi:hypothetical protein
MKFTIIEFIGGAWDGMNLCDGSSDPIEASLACHVLKATDDGMKGMGVIMPQKYAVRGGGCNYVVTDRTDVKKESLVRLECQDEDYPEIVAGENRTIILHFQGGCLNGRTLQSDADDTLEALLATAHYCLTNRGAISRTLRVPLALCQRCQPKSQCGEYRVVRRGENERSIEVTFEYVGEVEQRA